MSDKNALMAALSEVVDEHDDDDKSDGCGCSCCTCTEDCCK